MTTSLSYADAIEQFQQLGFAREINKIVVNLVEHHVLNDTSIGHPTRALILAVIVTELGDAARQQHIDSALALSQAIRVRMFYWKGTARMRHGTFAATGDNRLDPYATDRMFYALRHIADALEYASGHTTLYQKALTPA